MSAAHGILIASTVGTSIMDVGFTKENVSVLDSAAQTKISVFLQNSSAEIRNRNLQGISNPTLW